MIAESSRTPGDISTPMRQAVRWAFLILLGRQPENDDIITMYAQFDSVDALAKEIMRSPEFSLRHPSTKQYWGELPFESQFVMTELKNGTRFWVNMLDSYVSRAIHLGDYEPSESAFVRNFLKPGMSALDIGANLGWFTVMMSKAVGSKGRVTSFEPRSDLFKYLTRTMLENNLKNVKLFNYALGAEQADVRLRWDPTGINPGGTQLFPEGGSVDGMAIGSTKMQRLDDLGIEAVDFIKIDVEGAEKIVFDGASKLLARTRPMILAELSPDSLWQVSRVSLNDYISFLNALRYTVHNLNKDGSVGERFSQWTFANSALLSVILVPGA